MSTPAVTPDPYAAYGGSVASGGGADPYAAYGGKVAPPAAPAADTRSLLQKAKDNFNATVQSAQGAQPGDGAVKGFLENVGQGGVKAVNAIAHPLDTLSSMAQSFAHPVDTAHAEVDQLRSDPSRFIGNAVGNAAVGGVAGEGAGALVKAAAPAIVNAAGRVALLGKTPEGAYESALKPSVTLSPADRTAIVKTGLSEGIPVSGNGLDKLGDLIDNYNQKIKDEISSDPTRPIDPNKVASRADQAKAKFANQVNSQPDLNAIEASKQQFLDEQGAKPGNPAVAPQPTGLLDAQGNPIMSSGTPAQPSAPAPPMNASDAQTMKQGTYGVLRGKFGEQGSAAVEAQKALARGLKEEIATQFPEINNLNASESKLLDLQPVLERAVNRISNHQAIGIGTPIAGAAAKAVSGSGVVGVVSGVLKGVLDSPELKSKLAIAISKSSKIPYSQALSKVQNYSSALGSATAAGSTSGTPEN